MNSVHVNGVHYSDVHEPPVKPDPRSARPTRPGPHRPNRPRPAERVRPRHTDHAPARPGDGRPGRCAVPLLRGQAGPAHRDGRAHGRRRRRRRRGDGDGDWSERTARLARALRAALLAHRDGARVFAGTHATGPNTLRFADGLVGVLREAGFGDGDAARALYSVANFTVGHTLEEQAALTPGAVGPSTRRPCARRWRQGPIPTSPQPCRCSPVRISRHTSSSGCGCSWTDCAPSGSDPGAPSGSLGAVSPPPAGRGRSVAACEAGSAGDRDESGAVTGHVRRRQSGRGDDDGGSGEDGGRAGLARRPAGGVLGARPPRRPPGRPGSGTDGGGQRLGPTIPEEHVPQPWLPGVRGQAVRSSG